MDIVKNLQKSLNELMKDNELTSVDLAKDIDVSRYVISKLFF